jgi:ketosteroid isomerase-like protein
MSDNSERIWAGYDAWNRDDLDAWLETFHPDAELRTSGVWPDFDPVYRGKEGLAEFGLVVELVSLRTADEARETLRQRQRTLRTRR